MKSIQKFIVLALLFFIVTRVDAQDPNRYKNDVEKLYTKEYNFNPDKKLVVFAGSSSVRMWKDVQDYFPAYNVINNGFGGSHYSDLIYFYEQLILKQKPDILFIYEGDNDIANHKKPSKVSKEAKSLIEKIQVDMPETRIVIVSPKPCIKRWELREDYTKLNKRLYKLSKKNDIGFADVWTAMLDDEGVVFQDIFIEDGVHMNKKGYDIWAKVIGAYLN